MVLLSWKIEKKEEKCKVMEGPANTVELRPIKEYFDNKDTRLVLFEYSDIIGDQAISYFSKVS